MFATYWPCHFSNLLKYGFHSCAVRQLRCVCLCSQISLKPGKANQARRPLPSNLLLWDCQVLQLQDVLAPACPQSARVSSQLHVSTTPPKKFSVDLGTQCLSHLSCGGAVDWHVLRFLRMCFYSERLCWPNPYYETESFCNCATIKLSPALPIKLSPTFTVKLSPSLVMKLNPTLRMKLSLTP